MIYLLLLLSLLIALEMLYLRIADRLNIIDKPNQRSSHSIPVVRGGGIIFPIAWMIMTIGNGFLHPYFTTGLILLSIISFWDDLKNLSARQRFLFQVCAGILLAIELKVWNHMPIWGVPITLVCVIGILNAFNFMDGINGMTGMYALSFLFPLIIEVSMEKNVLQSKLFENPLIIVLLSILVFGFYNFRRKARCFAGDVGSISIGFIMLYFLLALMTGQASILGFIQDNDSMKIDITFILMFSVYGVDTVLTILQRLKLRENIFEPHRRHLYQYMANELGISHLAVSFIYALTQGIINWYILSTSISLTGGFMILGGLSITYLIIKNFPTSIKALTI